MSSDLNSDEDLDGDSALHRRLGERPTGTLGTVGIPTTMQ
jgi:hypothetical protein